MTNKASSDQIAVLQKDIEYVKITLRDVKDDFSKAQDKADKRWEKVDNSIQEMNNSWPVIRNDLNLLNRQFFEYRADVSKTFENHEQRLNLEESRSDEQRGALNLLKVISAVLGVAISIMSILTFFNR